MKTIGIILLLFGVFMVLALVWTAAFIKLGPAFVVAFLVTAAISGIGGFVILGNSPAKKNRI